MLILAYQGRFYSLESIYNSVNKSPSHAILNKDTFACLAFLQRKTPCYGDARYTVFRAMLELLVYCNTKPSLWRHIYLLHRTVTCTDINVCPRFVAKDFNLLEILAKSAHGSIREEIQKRYAHMAYTVAKNDYESDPVIESHDL